MFSFPGEESQAEENGQQLGNGGGFTVRHPVTTGQYSINEASKMQLKKIIGICIHNYICFQHTSRNLLYLISI